MTEKTLVSTFTLIGSLASYYYGKTHEKDVVPYVMIGGFIGAWVGEIISKAVIKKDDEEK
ncbi:MAG: hypothetical protein HY062_07520 [Bacteroidetes bacterium]|nr:hypothetical protein [Bacteroidota bacterium]